MSDYLDNLMLEYLDALDTYQSLRAALSTHLTAGFIALAQANFHSPNNTRYGRDSYDGRMSAQLGVSVLPPSSPLSPGNEFTSWKIAEDEDAGAGDPLRWFGILVPRALRTAKSEFGSAVGEVVPALVTARGRVAVLLRRIECGRVRFVYFVLKTAVEEVPLLLLLLGGGGVGEGEREREGEGGVGLCTAGQVAGVVAGGGVGDVEKVWVVKISCARVGADLKWEGEEGGEWFPRLVGEGVVGAEDVVDVREFERGEEGWGGVFDGVEWLEG